MTTLTDALTASIPYWGMTLAALAVGAGLASKYMKAHKYNTALIRMADAAQSTAGRISIDLLSLKVGTNLLAARDALLSDAVKETKVTMAGSIAATGYTDLQIAAKIEGALGNNPLHAALFVPPVVASVVEAVPSIPPVPPPEPYSFPGKRIPVT